MALFNALVENTCTMNTFKLIDICSKSTIKSLKNYNILTSKTSFWFLYSKFWAYFTPGSGIHFLVEPFFYFSSKGSIIYEVHHMWRFLALFWLDYYSASTMKLLLNLNCSSIPETLEVQQTFVTVVLSNVCSLSFQYYYTYENCNILISLLKFLTRTLKHRFRERRVSRPLRTFSMKEGESDQI